MSAPTTHDPLVVNTRDGVTWVRRAVVEGRGLYAVTDSCKCPPYLMATLAELAEHGIAGSADVLPVPVGPEPSQSERLRAAYIAALDEAHQTHPCPVTGRPYWTGCVHYDEAGRVAGVGSCHSERRADAVLAVRDVEMDRLRSQVAALQAERRSTNEALDDAVQALRAEPERLSYAKRARRESSPAKRQAWLMLARVEESERVADALLTPEAARSTDRLTRLLEPSQALREDVPAHPAPCRFPKSPGCTCRLTGAELDV